uniref:Pectinesterase n=2 Tax=Allium cepa TaxID=4679 RepID=G1CSU9_ALLCE|nr:pectin methylesterase [Allium cepa]
MAFQDFGPLSERRRQELEQRRRKRIMIAGGALCTIVIIAAVSAVAIIYVNKNGYISNNTKNNKHSHSGSDSDSTSSHAASTSSKLVQTLCSPTDYKETCISSLSKATNSSSKPKDIIKAAVSVIYKEASTAFEKAKEHKTSDPQTVGAIEVCERLLNESKSDLMESMDKIDVSSLEDLPKAGPVLNVWLSAVRSYQETCVDSFPEGESRDKMKDAMKTVNELTSNALAIIQKAGSFLSELNVPGFSRRLLTVDDENKMDGQGLPWWVMEHHEHRRSLVDDQGLPWWVMGHHEHRRSLVDDQGLPWWVMGHHEHRRSLVDDQGLPWWVMGHHEHRRSLVQNAAATLKPNVVVAQDGSGQFTTIMAAINAMPEQYDGRYVIYVKAGVYDEQVTIKRELKNITMYGDGSEKTIVTGSKNFNAGTPTFLTATFAVMGDGFMCIGMGFRNTAGPEGHQAVALRVQADCAVFLNCRMEAYQDTLYAQSKRQFYRGCVIIGTVDYIFGDASAIFQNCVLAVRRPGDNQQNIVTAHGRIDKHESTGFVIHNCKIIANDDLAPVQATFKSYLARPWKAYSRTVIMETEIADLIDPVGYLPWGDSTVGQDTCFYGEYSNRGPGANTDQRATWKGVKKALTKQEAEQFTASSFLVDVLTWVKNKGVPVPVRLTFFKA